MKASGFIQPAKTVVAINPDGSVYAVYNSARDASREFGVIPNTINRYCYRQRIGMGKRWLYEEAFRELYKSCMLDTLQFTLPEDYRPGKAYFHKGHKHGNGWEKRSEEDRRKFIEFAREQVKEINRKKLNRKGSIATSKMVVCLDDGNEFPSIRQAAKHYGVSSNLISWAIHRTRKAKGLRFRLKSQLENIKEVI